MKTKKVVYAVVSVLLLLIIIAAVTYSLSSTHNAGKSSGGMDFTRVRKSYKSDIDAVKNGKYSNLVVSDEIECDIESIEKIYDIEIEKDMTIYNNTHKENLERLMGVIKNFYGNDFDTSMLTVNAIYDNGEEEQASDSMTLEMLKNEIDRNRFNANKYYILFGDASILVICQEQFEKIFG